MIYLTLSVIPGGGIKRIKTNKFSLKRREIAKNEKSTVTVKTFLRNFQKCKFVNEILIVFQKNFRKCGKSLFCDYKNRKKITHLNKTT